jgi:hypothetical protein
MPCPYPEDNFMYFLHLARPDEGKEPHLKSKKMVIIHKLEVQPGRESGKAFSAG